MDSIRRRISCHLKSVPSRRQNVASWYFLMLLLSGRRNSLTAAAQLSGMALSSFSTWLSRSSVEAAGVLTELLCTAIANVQRKPLVPGAPWNVAIIVDATLHRRSRSSIDNAQKFNHGKGWVVGHQWTNIVLLIDGITLPMAPIPFYTKGYCKKHGLTYKSEHTRVREYLWSLDLSPVIGKHEDHEIVVLMDSGYDDRNLYQTILMRGWDLVCGLRSDSQVRFASGRFRRVGDLFTSAGLEWKTVYAFTDRWKKRMDFRVSSLPLELRAVKVQAQVVCSEPRRDRLKSSRKFLYCSLPELDLGVVVRTYRLRWAVEIFHRDIKSHLGLEDVSAQSFDSVEAHVRWLYATYLFLLVQYPEETTARAQEKVRAEFEANKYGKVARLADRFGGSKQVKRHCQAVVEELMAS